MGVIQSQSVVTKTTKAELGADAIKKLVAADLNVDPKCVSLNFRLKGDDYDGPGCSSYSFSHIEVVVTEYVSKV